MKGKIKDMRIAHLADLHIRGQSRHKEYKVVFEAFCEDVRAKSVDAIVIAGDIFHTKTTGISPEYIDFLTWLLRELSAIAPVHMTLGNHDGALTNLSRQDAVSPIVSALDDSRVKLYKNSGVYPLNENVNFCVFSLFDEPGWGEIKPSPGFVNIATYHGPVLGAFSESDWAIEHGLEIKTFEGFDFVLLGDIHKQQHLAYRQDKNGAIKPWISYPGSTIQQNYAEALDHGYLLWDIKSVDEWDVSFEILPNPQPFVTIEWSGDERIFQKQLNLIKENSRIRVKSDVHVSQHEIGVMTEALQQHSPIEITFKVDTAPRREALTTSDVKLDSVNMRDPRTLAQLVREFHGVSMVDVTDETLTSTIKDYLSSATVDDEVARGSRWSIRHLKFDNVFSYGSNNVINFDNIHGVTGIFAPNATGKSSILGALMYVLYNATDRGSVKNQHVCNIRHQSCNARVIVTIDGTDYVFHRETTKHENKRGQYANTTLNVWKLLPDNQLVDLAGEQRTDTEKVIRSLIGTADDVLLTCLSTQGDADAYVKRGSSSRRQVLARFLDLDIFDKMHRIINEDVKAYKTQLKSFPDREWDKLVKQLKTERVELTHATEKAALELDDINVRIAEIRKKLADSSGSEPVTTAQVDAAKGLIVKLETQIDAFNKELNALTLDIENQQEKIKICFEEKNASDIDTLKEQHDKLTLLQKSVIDVKHSHDVALTKFKHVAHAAKTLKTVPCGDAYPTCRFIKDAHEAAAMLKTQEDLTQMLQQKLEALQEDLNKCDKSAEDKLNRLEKITQQLSKAELTLSRDEIKKDKLNLELNSATSRLSDAQLRYKSLLEAWEKSENSELIHLRNELKDIETKKQNFENLRLELARRQGVIETKVLSLRDEKRKRDQLLSEMKVTELLALAFSKKGIPNQVVATQLPVLNAEIAKILSRIVNFTVEFEVSDGTEDLDLYINYGDSRRVIELSSGMEKMISSIAIRVALTNISSLPRPDLFVIDEGFGALDDGNLEACGRLITSLTRYYKKILVISHIDQIKEIVDNIIEVSKIEKDARVFVE